MSGYKLKHEWTDNDTSIPSFQLSAETDLLLQEFQADRRHDSPRLDTAAPFRARPTTKDGEEPDSSSPVQGRPASSATRLAKTTQRNAPTPTPRVVRIHGPTLLARPKRLAQADEDEDLNAREGQKEREAVENLPVDDVHKESVLVANPFGSPPPAAPKSALQIEKHKRRNCFMINKKEYSRLTCIGRGGSCRVYRVLRDDTIFALKRVDLRDVDVTTVRGYKSEIDLLKKLIDVDRVVNLIDWEMKHEKLTLNLLMEFGDMDFDSLFRRQMSSDSKFDINFTRHYWKEMIECVAAVHNFDIVHSDLKPANFVLFADRLKLIDFGIANLIEGDTINVHRDHQVGTPNFMAPEALLDTKSPAGSLGVGGKLVKVGKPSDVWSLGCILYQLTYGKAPFAHIQGHLQKAMAIVNPEHTIEYPPFAIGEVPVPSGLLKMMKACLYRDQCKRPTAHDLLEPSNPFLHPDFVHDDNVELSQEHLGRIFRNVVRQCASSGIPTDQQALQLGKVLFEKLKLEQSNV